MLDRGFAYFIERPRRIEELMCPQPIDQAREYEIVKVITLAGIDYENFITDMVADRVFLETNAHLCSKQDLVVKCLLVKCRKTDEGVLVVPDRAWVDIAALLLRD